MEPLHVYTSSSKKALRLFYCNLDSMNSGGQTLWNVSATHAMSKLSSDGRNPHERRFEERLCGPNKPLVAKVEHHPISAKDQTRHHQFGKKVFPGFLMGRALHAERSWKTYSKQTLRKSRRSTHPRSSCADFVRCVEEISAEKTGCGRSKAKVRQGARAQRNFMSTWMNKNLWKH